MGCAASTQEDDLPASTTHQRNTSSGHRGSAAAGSNGSGRGRVNRGHHNNNNIAGGSASSSEGDNNTDNDHLSADGSHRAAAAAVPAVLLSPAQQAAAAKKQLSPLNGRTVCSVALVDALPRYIAPTDIERSEMKKRRQQLQQQQQQRAKTNMDGGTVSSSLNSILSIHHHDSATGSSTPVPHHLHNNNAPAMTPSNIELVAQSMPFTSLQRLPPTISATTAAPEDDDNVMTTMSPGILIGHHDDQHPTRFTEHGNDDIVADRVAGTDRAPPPLSGTAMVATTPQHQHQVPQDDMQPPATAHQQYAHHVIFAGETTNPHHLLGAGGGNDDCGSPFSRASSGGARDCSICLAPVSGCSVVVMACLHTFHYECAKVWLSQHEGSCPDCRTKVCVDSFTYPQEVDGDAEYAAAQQAGEDLRGRYDDADAEEEDDDDEGTFLRELNENRLHRNDNIGVLVS